MAKRPRDLLPRRGIVARHVEPRPDDSGAAAVEFALVAMLLVLLMVGIVNFGLIFATQISLNAASRDAARAAVVKPSSGAMNCGQIVDRALQSVTAFGSNTTSGTKVVVTTSTPGTPPVVTTVCSNVAPLGQRDSTPCTSAVANTALTVAIQYGYVNPVPLVPPNSAQLTANATFRCEYP